MSLHAGAAAAVLAVITIGVVAFCLLGPYSYLGGAFALDFGGKQASASSSGIIDGVGYIGGVLAGDTVARVARAYGWEGVFVALAVVSALAAVCAGVLLRPDHQSCEICCMSEATAPRIKATPELLTVEWADGGASEFSSLWLRDNLAGDRDAHSGQRLIDITDLPRAPAHPRRDARERRRARRLRGRDARRHRSASRGSRRTRRGGRRDVPSWRCAPGSRAARSMPRATSPGPASLRCAGEPAARLAWLTRLLQDGLAFLEGVPTNEGAILSTVPLIGRVLETNYGLTFDVRSVPQPENLAYSDLGLGLHTDNPYRDPVPGFQALHALIASNEGGDSLFADGFALAAHLRTSDPEAFGQLTSTAIPFLYRSKDAELYAERPLIQLSASGAIAAVHYNSRSIAPLAIAGADAARFYAAYRRFAALLHEPRWQLRTRLDSGTLVVFDNQRVLHGRTAFSSARHPRHLQGCYLTRDSVYSEAALLRRRLAGPAVSP